MGLAAALFGSEVAAERRSGGGARSEAQPLQGQDEQQQQQQQQRPRRQRQGVAVGQEVAGPLVVVENEGLSIEGRKQLRAPVRRLQELGAVLARRPHPE